LTFGFTLASPTAVQPVGDAHETPKKIEFAVPLGNGTTAADHLVPFQISLNPIPPSIPVRAAVPIATQLLADTHDMSASTAPARCGGSGAERLVQVLPFHASIRKDPPVFVLNEPTAMQFLADVHDTANKVAITVPGGAGGLLSVHVLPFHFSASGAESLPPLVVKEPVAMQNFAVTQEIPDRLVLGPGGAGGTVGDHALPFQNSARGKLLRPVKPPAATQFAADRHDTCTSGWAPMVPAGNLTGTAFQLLPFQVSASGPPTPPNAIWLNPTATQFFPDVHETPRRRFAGSAAGLVGLAVAGADAGAFAGAFAGAAMAGAALITSMVVSAANPDAMYERMWASLTAAPNVAFIARSRGASRRWRAVFFSPYSLNE
jgi:hypothetical protein